MKHFGHREPVVTKITLDRKLFVKISGSPIKVHENSADGLVADARSQAGGRVLRTRRCFLFLSFFIAKRTLANPTSTSPKKKKPLVSSKKGKLDSLCALRITRNP